MMKPTLNVYKIKIQFNLEKCVNTNGHKYLLRNLDEYNKK